MNKIYKVMYSKVKQCAVVVSEIAKSHGHHGESSSVRKHAALMAAVLIALGSLSFTTAFMPMTAEAAITKTKTDGADFVGVERTDGLFDDSDYANHKGQGAHGDDSITVGLKASGGDGTITIGDRRAEQSLGSVYVGRGPGMPTGKVLPDKTDDGYWATSVGYQSDATGYGSIAIGSNATANNSYDKDSTGHGITLRTTSGDSKTFVLNGKPDIQRASVAIGYGASADNGNIAIGSYSDASTDLRTATTTDGEEIKSYLTDTMADSYVSVGKSGALRRISNVADGAADSDVATIGQLKALSDKAGVYNKGWGIKIADEKDNNGKVTKKNAISVDRNLGTNLDTTGHVHLDVSKTGLVLGTVVDGAPGTDVDLHYGATGDYAVTVGGGANTASGKASVVIGGSVNTASDEAAVSSGGSSNVASGSFASVYGGFDNEASGTYASIFAGAQNKASNMWTTVGGGALNEASGTYASNWGGYGNKATDEFASVYGGVANSAYGTYSAILGGGSNKAGSEAVVSGGLGNEAAGLGSAVVGGEANIVTGANATALGGTKGSVNGVASVGILGGSTGMNAPLTLAAGYQSTVTDTGVTSTPISEEDYNKILEAGGTHPGLLVGSGDPDNPTFKILDHFATAVGYQATADEAQTVAFGHDKGDTYYGTTTYTWKQKATVKDGHYYDEYGYEINEDSYKSLMNADGTWNDYAQPIATVEEKKYDSAYYNRLVKVADGIEDHDAVVMEQLKNASGVGSKIKVYQTDENGNIKFDKNNNPIEDTSDSDAVKTKREAAQKASEDAWGKAIGTGKIADPTKSDTNDPEANGSQQLVTGGTVYTEVRPATDGTYVKTKNTTAANLTALDKQVAANTTKLGDKNHNIKYYSVEDKISDDKLLPSISGYSNEKNDGAKGAGSMAAGFNTHADGIASTVAGSYSGVIGTGLQGAAALSYGTFNVNQNTDAAKDYSGVANSIVGQANMTKDSNAAIIYGAGNTVTNSYRKIDDTNASEIMQAALSKDVKKLDEALQKAVPTSGGQVMVMGGGNNVESAYMTQVVGVGNTVRGNQVYTKDAKTGEWNWTTDANEKTAIKDYDPKKSSQYNYVDGFSNEVINGKHDYIIGSNNKVSGDSVGTNQSNIIFGDNHKMTNTKNAVIIGSTDKVTEIAGSDAVSIGYNANAGGESVALGSNAVAGGNALAVGPYANAKNNSIALGIHASATSSQNLAIGYYANVTGRPDTIKNSVALGSSSTVGEKDILSTDNEKGVLSIGAKDNERRIIHVRAGVNDTDAVNVSQLKSVQSGLTDKGLTFVTNDGEHTAKLGSKVTIQGTAKKADHEYTADNLTTQIDKDGNINILMDKDMSVEKLAVNGKDGKDGQLGTPGSIGIKGQDGEAGIGIDGKNGISIKGKDGKNGVTIKVDNGKDGKDGSEGHIGLNGKDGSSIDITVKNGYDGANGINGKNGVDGTSLTRIVYTDKTGEHQVATMEDGLKFKGDDTTVISKKLNNTLEIIGGAKGDLTEGNIGVNSTKDGKLKVQLAKDLTGITSISNQKTEGDKTTGAKITLGNDGSVNVNGGKITNVGSGIEVDEKGKYTVTDQNKGNAANIGDVQHMVNDAKKDLTEGTNGLNNKANIDASNIGTNLKDANGNAASTDAQKANAKKWGSAIGTGEIKDGDGRMVTGKTVYDEVRPKNDGSYVKKDKTTGENLSALDSKIGKLDETKKYNYINSKSTTSISDNLGKLDTQVKNNVDAIQNINNNIGDLSDSAVKYDADTNKGKVTLAGADGTTITNLKAGEVTETSKDAVNGSQLYAEQKARTDADNKLTSDLAAETQARTAADTAINNKIGSLDKDGSYIRKENNVSQNLSALDSGLKTTSDLINTNDKRDTIQIGGSSTATKIDVSGKDAKGNTTGRVVTGVVTDVKDASSAANVGYVNGVTAANTQQIYRDMNNAYGRLNNNINKAAAGSNALAALHPLDYDPDDKADFAVGYGHYRNANAAAVGAFYHPNENTMVNVGVSLGNGDPGFNAGVSFKIGSGSAGHQAMSKTEMAKVINSQSKEIDALKKDNADKDKRIDALEQKMAEILAKLDKNGK